MEAGIVLLGTLVALLVLGVLGYLLWKVDSLSGRVRQIESRLTSILEALRPSVPAPPLRNGPDSSPHPEPLRAPALGSSTAEEASLPRPLCENRTPMEAQNLILDEAPAAPSRTREEWEALIGGRLLNRIGALALIIGAGFFFKYAFDRNWITEPLRVLVGGAVGAALLLGGARFHDRGLQIFAQGLLGAGFSILYLSVYASFNFYHLVPQWAAIVLMSGVTALAFFRALRYDSLAISLLGWAGGFLTPALLRTHQVNHVGLFSYMALLDAGLLAVVLRKDAWVLLEGLTFGATGLIFLLWCLRHYSPLFLGSALFFLTVFWALFYGLDLYRARRASASFCDVRQGIAILNGALYYGALYGLIDPGHPRWMGLVTAGLGAVYFLAYLVVRGSRPEDRPVLARHALTAIVLMVLATSIQFSGFTTVFGWSLEALLLILCGARFRLRYVWQAGLGLFAIAVVKLMATGGALAYAPLSGFTLLINTRAATFLWCAATLGAAAFFLGREGEEGRRQSAAGLLAGGCLLLLLLLTVETNDFFLKKMVNIPWPRREGLAYGRTLTLSALWMIASLPLVWAGLAGKVKTVLFCGMASMVLATLVGIVAGAGFVPVETFRLLFNLRFAVLGIVVAGLAVHARLLQAQQHDLPWAGRAVKALPVVIVLVILEIVTGEIWHSFSRAIHGLGGGWPGGPRTEALTRLSNLRDLSLSGAWLVYSIVLMGIGIAGRRRTLRFVAIGLFGLTILKIFIYDLSFLETFYRIFSFVGLGVILLLTSYLYQSYHHLILEDGPEKEGGAGPAKDAG